MYVRTSLTQIATGWYSADAWDAIRTTISASYHALLKASKDVEASDNSDSSDTYSSDDGGDDDDDVDMES